MERTPFGAWIVPNLSIMGILPYIVRGCAGDFLGNNLAIGIENDSFPSLRLGASSYISMGMKASLRPQPYG